MSYDLNYQTTEGTYWKDLDGRELTRDEPRVSGPSMNDTGKFNWPRIKLSTGDIVKIAFRLFNDEERECYKAYRKRGKTTVKQDKPVQSAKPAATVTEEKETYVPYRNEDSTPSAQTLALIASCNQYAGTWIFEGTVYAILSIKGMNKRWHIPKCLIPEDDMIRLCNYKE